MCGGETYTAILHCPICGKTWSSEVWSERQAASLESSPRVCPGCTPIRDRENAEVDRALELEDAKKRALETASQRMEESQLNRYELGFDPQHPRANLKLARWMTAHRDHCVWVFGQTGLGKTRVLQNEARQAVLDRSVRYWPAYDLSVRLTETSKRPESQLLDIYMADLLVLDDLGIANMTEARLRALAAIVDRRYIGWDQVRRSQGAESPTFGWSSYGSRRALGGQIWISSQVPPEELVRQLSAVSATDAAAIVRRLADMCVIHEAEEVGR